jgi:ribonuclease HI
MENKYVLLFSDGSCLGNPGPGGIGYIISYHKDSEIIGSQGYILTTNNRMEIRAVINGLKNIIENINNETIIKPSSVLIYTDSKYVTDSFNQGWLKKWIKNNWMTSNHTPVKNKDLWVEILDVVNIKLKKEMDIDISISHIPGHAGHDYNERCDKLAQSSAKGDNLIIDEGYQQ